MKQHITKEQLNDLSDVGKDKLHEWWIANQDYGEVYKIYHPTDLNNEKPSVSIMDLDIENCPTIVFDEHNFAKLEYPQHENWQCLPLLSIGQMIEFLDNWGTEYDFCVWKDVCANHPAQHLCDALWEEIKSVLQK